MWRKQVAQAERKRLEGKGDKRDEMLLGLHAQYKDATGPSLNDRLCIPLKGGDLFVSSAPHSSGAVIQADLNAAANIGLRALMDPDFAGKWWYVPCDPKTKIPKADKVKGGLVDGVGPLAVSVDNQTQKKKAAKEKTRKVVNLSRRPDGKLDRRLAAWRRLVGDRAILEWSSGQSGGCTPKPSARAGDQPAGCSILNAGID